MKSSEITERLLNSVLDVTNQDERILVIHSSLSNLGFSRGEEYLNGILGFLNKLLDMNKTIVLPSFNFTFPKKQSFNLKSDFSETGVLADLAREYLGFTRSCNPMFSFTLKGPDENEFLNYRRDSGYGKGTIVSRLNAEDVNIVMLGATWHCTTILHAIEEEMLVPYREYIHWTYPVDFGQGIELFPYELFVRKKVPATKLRFDRIRDVLLYENELRRVKLNGDISIESANGKKISSLARKRIKENPNFFVENI